MERVASGVEALAWVLASSTWDKHRTPATRPCGHCLAAHEQAERILTDPGPLLAALAEAGILHPQLCSRSGAACFNGWSGDE